MAKSDNSRTWTLRDIDTIFPYALNAKKHAPDQVKRVAESISKFGWRGNPIIVDKEGVILAGHGRRLAAISIGMKKVPVIVEENMTPEEARAFRLADNRAATGDLDADILREELLSLDFDLTGIFDKKELDFAVADLMIVNDDVFANDLDSVMDDQDQNTNEKIDKSASKRISIGKALGFNSVSGAEMIYVTRLMAQMEANSGMQGSDAFVHYAKSVVGNLANV